MSTMPEQEAIQEQSQQIEGSRLSTSSAKQPETKVVVMHSGADVQKRENASRKLLEGLWASVTPTPTTISLNYPVSSIRGAANILLGQTNTVEDSSSESDSSEIEAIPRKERLPRKPRFKRKRQPRNWLKICLTKAFHKAKHDAPRQERRRFDRERTVWRWVRKYRRTSGWQAQWQGIVKHWAEGFEHTDTGIASVHDQQAAVS